MRRGTDTATFAEVTAIILAGGESQRMGEDKAHLPVQGRTLIEFILNQLRPHFSEILLSARSEADFPGLGVRVIADKEPGRGPLMGIASAIAASANDLNFVQACDIPYIDLTIVKQLLDNSADVEVVMPQTPTGFYEPLFAVYRRSALSAMNEILAHERGKPICIIERCRTSFVLLDREREIQNLNTIEDYERFLSSLR